MNVNERPSFCSRSLSAFAPRRRWALAGVLAVMLGAPVPAACAQPAPAQTDEATGHHIVTVSSVEQLQDAMRAAEGPTRILVAPGRYGVVDLRNVSGGGQVEVSSADPGQRAMLAGLLLRNVSGFTIRDLELARYTDDPRAGHYLLLALSSSDLTFEGLTFRGMNQRVDHSVISAAMLRNSNDIVFAKNSFSYFRHGLTLLNVENLTIRFNEFTHMQTDAIRGGGVSNSLLANNVMTEFYPLEDDHPDGIQLWSTHQEEPGRNIRIRDNLVVKGNGGYVQGIFIRDTYNSLPFENIEISDNFMIGTLYNGIAIMGVTGARLSGNVVLPDPGMRSWIRIRHGRDVVLEDNRAEMFLLNDNPGSIRQTRSRQIGRSNKNIPARIREWVDSRESFAEYRGPLLQSLMAEQ